MKVQKFYPKQVINKLKGRSVDSLDKGEKAALIFFIRKGRKYGMAISIQNDAKLAELATAGSAENAATIQANSSSKILLKIA